MKKKSDINFTGKSKGKFFKQNGFYIALGLALIATAVTGWGFFSTVRADKNSKAKEEESTPIVVEWEHKDEVVENKKEDVPKVKEESQKAETSKTQSDGKTANASKTVFIMPGGTKVTKAFSDDQLVRSETMQDFRTHNGADISIEKGGQVKCIADGTVKDTKDMGMKGYCVQIDHGNGIMAYYYGLNPKVTVKAGDNISMGTVIGVIGDIPEEIAEESHLHLEITKDGKKVDPIKVINP